MIMQGKLASNLIFSTDTDCLIIELIFNSSYTSFQNDFAESNEGFLTPFFNLKYSILGKQLY